MNMFAQLAAAAAIVLAPASTEHSYLVPADRFGQFYVGVSIEGHPVKMMLDTGASDISLSETTAQQVELPGGGEQQVYTMANGAPFVCRRLKIPAVRVGDIIVREVFASICPGDTQPLLGTSFLRRVHVHLQDDMLEISARTDA